MLLHPSPNCSLRAESLVHVHFKEEIGIAELIPLVTTYIILFAYIYFSTRRSMVGLGRSPVASLRGLFGHRCGLCLLPTRARALGQVSGLGGSMVPLAF